MKVTEPPCHWRLLAESAVPEGDGWLGPEERRIQAGLRIEKRRRDWRLGRFTAKKLLIESGLGRAEDLARLSILADDDGAPEAHLDGRPLDLTVSISHSTLHGAAVAAPRRAALGCDLEKIEPRSAGLLETFFTQAEQHQVAEAGDPALVANLIWSAKESWLKACRTGLRRDTRSVEVTVETLEGGEDWQLCRIADLRTGQNSRGWWRVIRRPPGPLVFVVASGTEPA